VLTRKEGSFSIRAISSDRSDCGEGPIWNPITNVVTWVDIAGKKWHQASLDQNDFSKSKTFPISTVIGAIVERHAGGFFAAVEEGFGSIDVNGEYKLEIDFLPDGERMNDAKADARGRWWAGSTAMDFELGKGRLHVIEPDRKIRTIEAGLALPNGLAWSPDNKSFYLVDSMQRLLWRYDFDLETGNVAHRRVLVRFANDGSVPDGMTVADDGSLLVAIWDGSRIEVFSPDGVTKEIIHLPVKRPTSCTFAGTDGSTLVVTSAASDIDTEKEPMSGLTLAIEGLGYTGRPSEAFGG
jgi:sugar lactone lactonase YvrE